MINIKLLFLLEFLDGCLEGSNLLNRVAFLLALQGYYLLGCVSYEVLVAELLAYAHREAFQVLELSLCLLNLGSYVDRSPNGTANSSVPTMKLDASALFSAMTSILSRFAIFSVTSL